MLQIAYKAQHITSKAEEPTRCELHHTSPHGHKCPKASVVQHSTSSPHGLLSKKYHGRLHAKWDPKPCCQALPKCAYVYATLHYTQLTCPRWLGSVTLFLVLLRNGTCIPGQQLAMHLAHKSLQASAGSMQSHSWRATCMQHAEQQLVSHVQAACRTTVGGAMCN